MAEQQEDKTVTTSTPNASQLTQAQQNGLQLLMQRERVIQQKEAQLKQQVEQLQRQMQEFATKQQTAAGKSPDPLQTVSGEVQELKGLVTQLQEREKQYQMQQAWQDDAGRVKSWLGEQGEAYPLITKLEAADDVNQLIQATYQQTGELLSDEDAAKQVESYYSNVAKRFGVETVTKEESNTETGEKSKEGTGEVNTFAPPIPEPRDAPPVQNGSPPEPSSLDNSMSSTVSTGTPQEYDFTNEAQLQKAQWAALEKNKAARLAGD